MLEPTAQKPKEPKKQFFGVRKILWFYCCIKWFYCWIYGYNIFIYSEYWLLDKKILFLFFFTLIWLLEKEYNKNCTGLKNKFYVLTVDKLYFLKGFV